MRDLTDLIHDLILLVPIISLFIPVICLLVIVLFDLAILLTHLSIEIWIWLVVDKAVFVEAQVVFVFLNISMVSVF